MINPRTAPSTRALTLAFCAGLATLTGCMVGPDFKQPAAPANTPDFVALHGEDVATANAAIVPSASRPLTPGEIATWWQTFGDPMLDSLIRRAVAQSPDLRIATARVREARALRGIDAADLYPQIDAAGRYSRGRTSDNMGGGFPNAGQTTNLFDLGLDAGWEIDVFGGVRRSVQAADADVAAAEEARRDTLITLVAEVARNYVELRSFQRRVDVNRSAIQSQSETLDLTQSLARAGISSELQVEQSRAQLAARESQLPPLRIGSREAAYRLAVLMGQAPGSLLEELATATAIPTPPNEIPIGLPSELLRRRPDIRQAEQQIAAATARVGVATSDLFPKFSLTGSFGFQSEEADQWFETGSRVWSFGPAFRWSIFNAGKVRSQILAASAREEAALANYDRIVLAALEEIENALTVFIQEQARRRSLAAAESASRRALDLATERFKSGIGDFLNVLDAQRALYELQDQLVSSEAVVTRSLIAVYKALGGGWDDAVLLPPQDPAAPAEHNPESPPAPTS